MIDGSITFLSFLCSLYDRLSKKPLLFKSFTGLTVLEFDDISITKKWQKDMANMSRQRLSSKRQVVRERKGGAGRRFNSTLKTDF